MTMPMPYFMENEEWFYFDEKTEKYELTDKAPEEAVKSHKKFYETLDAWQEMLIDASEWE